MLSQTVSVPMTSVNEVHEYIVRRASVVQVTPICCDRHRHVATLIVDRTEPVSGMVQQWSAQYESDAGPVA